MLLAPGPIPEITSDWLDTSAFGPSFSDLVQTALEDLPGIEILMDLAVDPLAVIPDALDEDGSIGFADLADASIADMVSYDFTPDIAGVDAAENLTGEAIVNVYAAIPAEAFEPIPAPGNYGGGSPTPGQVYGLSATFENLTRPGATDFYELEAYEIIIVAPQPPGGVGVYAGLDVIQYRWFNEVAFDYVDMGQTDSQGFIHFVSSWSIGSAGQWKATFGGTASDGTVIQTGADVFWTVSPVPPGTIPPRSGSPFLPGQTPPPTGTLGAGGVGAGSTRTNRGTPLPAAIPSTGPYPIAVTFTNDTGASAFQLHVGDQWTLVVTGPPFVSVVVAGHGPTGILAPFALGQTDATGSFTLPGLVDASSIGPWSETYTVGGVAWQATLDFTVYA